MGESEREAYRKVLPYAQRPDNPPADRFVHGWTFYDLVFTDRRMIAIHLPDVPIRERALNPGLDAVERREQRYRATTGAAAWDAVLYSDPLNFALPYAAITHAKFEGNAAKWLKTTLTVDAGGGDLPFYWMLHYLGPSRPFWEWAKTALTAALGDKVEFALMQS